MLYKDLLLWANKQTGINKNEDLTIPVNDNIELENLKNLQKEPSNHILGVNKILRLKLNRDIFYGDQLFESPEILHLVEFETPLIRTQKTEEQICEFVEWFSIVFAKELSSLNYRKIGINNIKKAIKNSEKKIWWSELFSKLKPILDEGWKRGLDIKIKPQTIMKGAQGYVWDSRNITSCYESIFF